jgi:hypothetical protein
VVGLDSFVVAPTAWMGLSSPAVSLPLTAPGSLAAGGSGGFPPPPLPSGLKIESRNLFFLRTPHQDSWGSGFERSSGSVRMAVLLGSSFLVTSAGLPEAWDGS